MKATQLVHAKNMRMDADRVLLDGVPAERAWCSVANGRDVVFR